MKTNAYASPIREAQKPNLHIGAAEETLGGYVEAFSPFPGWDRLPEWPPDVFTATNLLIDHCELYRLAVAPRRGRWPPFVGWNELVTTTGRQWRSAVSMSHVTLPWLVAECWERVLSARRSELRVLRAGDSDQLCWALLTLHAIADEACAGLAEIDRTSSRDCFEFRAWELLERHGSLSRFSPTRVRILPKTHFAQRGLTIRSLSRYLALCYEPVDVRWKRVVGEAGGAEYPPDEGERNYNIVLLPWPLRVRASDFHRVEGPLENMDPEFFGFFEFAPSASFDMSYADSLLFEARSQADRVDAVIMPEGAIERRELGQLESVAAANDCTFIVAGVRERAKHGLGTNCVHVGVRTEQGWDRFEQHKHHRWALDDDQIHQYHLVRTLDPRKLWWEAIDLPARAVQIVDVGGGATTAPLVCEDLARLDEVADLLRRIGPTLVVGLLLDGPQLAFRWSSRYAGVLADDPGSAVLTLTSLGMATRCVPAGYGRSRSVALWHDGVEGPTEIHLARGAGAILITASLGRKTTWTADGRRHDGVPEVRLSRVEQLRG